ncbi:MAG: DUF1398 family protein [Parvibaculum sp.]
MAVPAMNEEARRASEECTRASDEERMSFPEVVGMLMEAGVERYYADLVRHEKTYYMADGASLVTRAKPLAAPAAVPFSPEGVEAAVRAIQAGQIKYGEFCARIAAAGCVAYLVSLTGARAVYYGRTGEAHLELFPAAT